VSWGSAEGRHSQLIPADEQVDKLKTAIAARRDASTVIIARTSALSELPLARGAAADRSRRGEWGRRPHASRHCSQERSLIEAVHEVTALPLCVVGLTQEMIEDRDFLERNAVRIRYFGQPVHGMAVKDDLRLVWSP